MTARRSLAMLMAMAVGTGLFAPKPAQADPVGDLISKLRANPALGSGSFAVVFRLTAKPGQEDAIRATMQRILPLTRAEPGCVIFALHRDADDPRTYFLYEQWRSVDDLAAHLRMPYITEAFTVYAASATDGGQVTFGVVLDQ